MALETPVITPPAPSAPAPAPVAPAPVPAPPEPSPAPSGEPSPKDENPFSEVWAKADAHIKEIDRDLSVSDKTKPKVEPAPKEPKVEAKPDPKAKPAEKPKSEPHKLRDELDARTAELTALKDTHTKLESKLKELETKGQDSSKVLERVGQLEKELEERTKDKESLASKLKTINLAQDPEFKKKFDERFNKEANSAARLVSSLSLLDAEGNAASPADWKRDFNPIYHLYKDEPAAALAAMKQKFGPDATTLLFPKLQKLWEINDERQEAIAEAEKNAAEMAQTEIAQASTRKQQLDALWVQTNRELSEKNPDFTLDPTDKELAMVRDESLRIFDGKPANDQQRLIKNAYIRQMVGSHAVLKMQNARLVKERNDLKTELDSLKNPAPPAKRTSGGAPTPEPDEDWASRAKRELAT